MISESEKNENMLKNNAVYKKEQDTKIQEQERFQKLK